MRHLGEMGGWAGKKYLDAVLSDASEGEALHQTLEEARVDRLRAVSVLGGFIGGWIGGWIGGSIGQLVGQLVSQLVGQLVS